MFEKSILRYLNPFLVVREYVRKPIEAFLVNQYLGYKKKTDESFTSVKELMYRVAIVTLFITVILWLSIFMYVGFYNIYMPNVTHVRPVHFQFKPCEDKAGICSYPYAYVQLTRASNILMPKQPYRIKLALEMPESQVNKYLVTTALRCASRGQAMRCNVVGRRNKKFHADEVAGRSMFMVCVQMRAKGGFLVSSSCRSAMIRYRSLLHHIMRTFVYSAMYLGGVDEEKQQLWVELFSDFEDDPEKPATDAYVELQSRFAEVYSSELHIQAHFTGLRYLMYNWPKISAVFGICTNLFFVSLVFILSWYHLQDGLPDFIKSKFRSEIKTEEDDDKAFIGKVKLEREDSASYYEEDALLKEFQQIESKEENKETKKTLL